MAVVVAVLAAATVMLVPSASGHPEVVADENCSAIYLPYGCNLYFTISPESMGGGLGDNAPALNGFFGEKYGGGWVHGTDGCSQDTPLLGVSGANGGASWTQPADGSKYYRGTNAGTDHVSLGVGVSGCNGWVYHVYVNNKLNGTVTKTVAWGDFHHRQSCKAKSVGFGSFSAGAVSRLIQGQCKSDPVDNATGAYSAAVTDITLASPGLPFKFTRYYMSNDNRYTSSGFGWHNDYDSYLTGAGTTTVTAYMGSGPVIAFTKNADGSFTGPGWSNATLALSGSTYTLTQANQIRWLFNSSSGFLKAIADRNNNQLQVSQVAAGEPATVTTSSGQVITFSYSSISYGPALTKVQLPDGRNVQYAYTDGNLTQVTDAAGRVTSYTYTTSRQLATETDGRGHVVLTNSYDPSNYGRVSAQTDARGKTTTYQWTPTNCFSDDVSCAGGGTNVTTDPRGHVWTDVFSDDGTLLSSTDPLTNKTSYTYDANDNPLTMTDPLNNPWQYQYDSKGNLTQTTFPDLVTSALTYTSLNDPLVATNARGYTTTYGYDSAGNLSSVQRQNGQPISYTYNSRGQVLTATDQRSKTTTFAYDTFMNLKCATSPLGEVTEYGYDLSGRLTSILNPRGNSSCPAGPGYVDQVITDGASAYWRLGEASGATATDLRFLSNGSYTGTVTYGQSGALSGDPNTAVTLASGASVNLGQKTAFDPTHSYTYEFWVKPPSGGISPDWAGLLSNFQGSNPGSGISIGARTSGAVAFQIGAGTGGNYPSIDSGATHLTNGAWNYVVVTYDSSAHVVKLYLNGSQVASATGVNPSGAAQVPLTLGHRPSDATGGVANPTVAISYDDLAVYPTALSATTISNHYSLRTATPGEPGTSSYMTTIAYNNDDQVTSVTDPLGHAWTYSYDADGNLATKTDPRNHTWTYEYDNANNLTKVTNPDLTYTTYSYDDAGNLASVADANGHTTSYGYDDANRLISMTDGLLRQWTFSYDADSRLHLINTPSGGTITYSYDTLGHRTGVSYSDTTQGATFGFDNNGNRSSMTDGVGSVAYSYDTLDRLTAVTRGTSAYGYTYDDAGNILTRTYPDGTLTTYGYDDDGRLHTTTTGTQTTTYEYDAAGNLVKTTLPNGVIETATYDHADRITQRNDGFRTFNYGYDNNGNVTSKTVGGTETDYTYDNLNRLLTATTGTTSTTYTYDNVGNRATAADATGTTTYSYDAANQLTSTTGPSGTTSYTYNTNGDETGAGSWTFTVDLAGRVTAASNGTVSTSYSYDGDGNRLSQATGANTTNLSWDVNAPVPQLASETDGSGNLLRRYIYGLDRISMTTPSTTGYYSTDMLGTVTEISSGAGASLGSFDNNTFGDNQTSSGVDPSVASNPFGFTGAYQDAVTALYDMHARQYDPATGRFLSQDPLGTPDASQYAYVGDNPLGFTDPTGMHQRAASSPSSLDNDDETTIIEKVCRVIMGVVVCIPHPGIHDPTREPPHVPDPPPLSGPVIPSDDPPTEQPKNDSSMGSTNKKRIWGKM